MKERRRYELALMTAEAMYHLYEAEYQRGERHLDDMMRRLKDLSAYSLTHAEIMNQREGPELLALAMVFGMSSDDRFQENQKRLGKLSQEALDYQGRAEAIEEEIAARRRPTASRKGEKGDESKQPRLL